MLLCMMLLLFSCSKGPNKEPDTQLVKKEATATFSKKTIKDYPTIFEGDYYDRISISDTHLYVVEKDNKKFRRYNLITNEWEDLASINSLFSGIAGYLISHEGENNKNILAYLGGELNTYYPPEYPDASLKDSWVSKTVLPSDGRGERGAASDGEYLYYMGNERAESYSRQVDRYNPSNNFWEENIALLPEKLNEYAQAVSSDDKLFVVGGNSESDKLFMIYDLQTKKWKTKSAPSEDFEFYSTHTNTLLVQQGYLIYMEPRSTASANLYVFDIEGDQWLEDHVEIEMDLFSKTSDNGSLLLSSSGKMYAAGTKAGEFVLYEVDFSVTEQ